MALIKFSFSQKVQLYACTVSLISLLLAGIAFISYDAKEFRRGLIDTLQLKADLVGNLSASAISTGHFNKPNELLDFIANDGFIVGAWVYSNDFNQIAVYDPKQLGFDVLPESLRKQGVYFDKHLVKVVRDIQVGKKIVGEVMIVSVLEGIQYHITYQILIVLMVSLISVLTAMIFSYRLQRSLTKPLYNLVQTVNTVTKKKDYSIRAVKLSDDDLGLLTDSFNNMLQEVLIRDDAISKSEERLNLALWASNEVMFDWNILGDNWYFDESFESLLGYDKTKIPTNKSEYFKLIHPDDVAIVDEKLQSHLIGESSYFKITHRVQHASGQWCWILARAKVVERNMRGRALRLAGTFMDITTRKETQERLTLFNKVFESTTEGVVVTDPQFRVIEINPAFSAITGYSRTDIIGHPIDVIYNENQNEEFYRHMRYALQLKGHWQGELWKKEKMNKFIYNG